MENNDKNTPMPQSPKTAVISRFFIDERCGCIAVRDRKHPSYDETYPGLHNDTSDVIFYAYGNRNENGWYVDERFVKKANDVLVHLQSFGGLLSSGGEKINTKF